MTEGASHERLLAILKILKEFQWLTDIYMVEYFTKNLWTTLPESWRSYFEETCTGPENDDWNDILSILIDFTSERVPRKIPPLSCLALRRCVGVYSVSRIHSNSSMGTSSVEGEGPSQPALNPNQRLKLKPKKEHEITRISQIMSVLQKRHDIERVVDIGSGLGHLSRLLSLSNGLKVTSIEANTSFVERARVLDEQWQRRKALDTNGWTGPRLCNDMVEMGDDPGVINNIPSEAAKQPVSLDSLLSSVPHCESSTVCVTGLHTCGDLAPSIIREFARNPKLDVLLSFGCCYLKLNGGLDKVDRQVYRNLSRLSAETEHAEVMSQRNPSQTYGFPMSCFLQRCDVYSGMSYAARALACHAIEQFSDRLQNPATAGSPRIRPNSSSATNSVRRVVTDSSSHSEIQPCEFLIHCYRAILEWLIVRKYPERRKEGLTSVKNAYQLDFKTYCEQTLRKRPDLKEVMQNFQDPHVLDFIEAGLKEWKRVIVLYSLRILMAPLIESVILLDREIYLKEQGISQAVLLPVFDAAVSARNIALLAIKNKL